MSHPTFTLVHRGPASSKVGPALARREMPDLAGVQAMLAALPSRHRRLKNTLIGNLNYLGPTHREAATEKLRAVAAEFQRQPKVTTVGVWDLGARVARLPALIERLNRAQPGFVFFEIEAGIPAGLISQPERILAWAQERLGKRLRPAERRDMARNLIANDFFPRAESVRTDLGVDYLVGLTPSMVAGEQGSRVYWNHFSTFDGRALLASVQDLRTFARQAHRPFESLVGGVIVAQLLVAMFHDRGLGFHDDRGCLFDYNASRTSLVRTARNPSIEPECLKLVPEAFRDSVLGLVGAIKTLTTLP